MYGHTSTHGFNDGLYEEKSNSPAGRTAVEGCSDLEDLLTVLIKVDT